MQRSVREFVRKYNLACGYQVRYMDLVSEVGEVGKELIKGSGYGKRMYRNTPETQDELGDCIFSLLALCEELGVDAEAALEGALGKYEKRFAEKADIGSGQ